MTRKQSTLGYIFLLSSYLILINHQKVTAQTPSRDLFDFVFENDFNDDVTGKYQLSDYLEDWNLPSGTTMNEVIPVEIVNNEDVLHKKTMRGIFPEGTYLPDNHGFLWFAPVIDPCNELYFSYDVRFKPGFEWVMGGKLPGLTGGKVVSGIQPGTTDGFSARMVWKEEGKLVFYVYHQDQPLEFGTIYFWGDFRFNTGQWYNLTLRLVLNTFKDNVAQNDGVLEGFVDGKLYFQKKGINFRSLESIQIDNMYICSFFGGGTDDWAATRDEWLDTDNYVAYTYSSKATNIARGNVLSPVGNILLHPYYSFSSTPASVAPVAPSSFTATTISKSSIGLQWTDNSSNEQGFKLYRSLSSNEGFSEIATIAANSTSFTDNALQPGTEYYYKLNAFYQSSYSSNTPVLHVTTTLLDLPSAPSLFISAGQSKTTIDLSWKDNSSREEGFKLYRSTNAVDNFIEIITLPANTSIYTDNSLQPGTDYYYKLTAYNQDGFSDFTPVLIASTLLPEIPEAPSGLIASHIDYTLAKVLWTDNSKIETGFEMERSGPNNKALLKQFTLPVNAVSFSDTGLIMNSTYTYRIRAIGTDGHSTWSNLIEIVTPRILPPQAPTKLKSTKFTDKSISVSWNDNSTNEDAFIITRSLAMDPTSAVTINIGANDTSYTDSSLVSSTTYQYTIKAVNTGGSSALSNKNVGTTLSVAELKRVKNGLVAYYNFGFNPDYIVYDQSGYGDPVNLQVLNRSAVLWNDNNTMDILSNTGLVSMTPATKIIQAIKKSNELTFECWIKPMEPDYSAGSRIVSLARNDDEVGFLLDQGLTDDIENRSLTYSIRMQTESTSPSGYPEFIPDRTQSYINLQHLVFLRDSMGTEYLFLNGVKSSEGFRPSDLGNWEDNYYLRLGNESDMNHPWRGSYYSVAFYDRALASSEILTNYNAGPSDNIQNSGTEFFVEVIPNPIQDHAYVTVTPEAVSDFIPQTMIRILDVYGKVMYQENVFNPNNRFSKQLDFNHYPSGVYFIQVISGKNQKSAKVIVHK